MVNSQNESRSQVLLDLHQSGGVWDRPAWGSSFSALTEPSQLSDQAIVAACSLQHICPHSLARGVADTCPHFSLLVLLTNSVDTSKPSRVPQRSIFLHLRPVYGTLLRAYRARLPVPRLPSSALACLSCVPVEAAVPPNLPSRLSPVCFYVTERAGFISLCMLGPFNRAGLKVRHFEACATPNCKRFYETHFCASQPGHRTAT